MLGKIAEPRKQYENARSSAHSTGKRRACHRLKRRRQAKISAPQRVGLFLTRRAIKDTAVSKGDSFDRARTDPAVFAVAVVDPQVILKLAVLVIRVAVIRKRSAAPANRFMQHRWNHFSDPRYRFA